MEKIERKNLEAKLNKWLPITTGILTAGAVSCAYQFYNASNNSQIPVGEVGQRLIPIAVGLWNYLLPRIALAIPDIE